MSLAETVAKVGSWHEFHKRSRAPLFSQLFLGGTCFKKEGFPFDNRAKHFGIFLDHVAIETTEKERLAAIALAHLKDHPTFLLELMERAYREHAEAIAEWKRADVSDVSLAWRRYTERMYSFGIYVTLPLFAENYFETYLKEEFEKRFGEQAQTFFGIAVDPVHTPSVLAEEQERLTLSVEDRFDEGVEAHAQKFGWMNNTGFFETYYDVHHYRETMLDREDALHKLKNIEHMEGIKRELFEDLCARVSDDPYLETIVRTANEAVYFRSYRTEMYYSSPAYNQELFHAVAKLIGLADHKDLVWLYADEIQKALDAGTPVDRERIEFRKTGYVFLSELDGAYHYVDGEEATAVYAAYAGETTQVASITNSVKGSGAYLGTVQGRAAVVHSFAELDKVEEGDILITHATNVDFVPVLRKVAGIVTEEGGILSHAAIISRELRIPCVIGTKTATSVFNDGDMVEVDAGTGIVRILRT